MLRRGIVFIHKPEGPLPMDTCPEPLPATEQQQQGHLPSASLAAADLQHPLRGVEAGDGGVLCSRELLKQVFVVLVRSFSRAPFIVTPWTAACQASQFFTISQSLLKLMSIESVMPSNHLILCHPLLLPSSIFPSIRVFSNESALRIRWS